MEDGAGFAGFAAGEIGQGPHDPDLAAMPDVRSFTPLPWRPNVARIACDVHVEGEEWPYCPRTILRRQLERARALGYEFKIGAELEYFLVRKREDGSIELADPLDTLDQPCYDMRGADAQPRLRLEVARNITALGWDNYATDHEDANGQFEQNFEFADALTTCDRAIFFRYMVESLAQERGLIATFMPKPFSHLTGNGCHFHMSLWRDGENVFEARSRRRPARARACRRPPTSFIGGLKAHAKAYIAVTAPTVTLLQAARGRRAQRLELGAGLRQLRLQQPHADAARAGARARRGPHGRRLVQPVPGGRGDPGRRARRDRARARPRRRRPPSSTCTS